MPRVIGETEEQASAKVPMYVSAVRTTTSGSLSNERLGDIVDHNGVRLAGLEVDAERNVGVHGPVTWSNIAPRSAGFLGDHLYSVAVPSSR